MILESHFGNYIVYSNGTVWSKKRKIFLRPGISSATGYTHVNMGGKVYTIHRLIAELFIPNPNNYKYVDHKNGNRQDASMENLCWTTQSLNISKAFKEGSKIPKIGEKHAKAILTDEQAKLIKYGHKDLKQTEIANLYRIGQPSVSSIRMGKTWKHI